MPERCGGSPGKPAAIGFVDYGANVLRGCPGCPDCTPDTAESVQADAEKRAEPRLFDERESIQSAMNMVRAVILGDSVNLSGAVKNEAERALVADKLNALDRAIDTALLNPAPPVQADRERCTHCEGDIVLNGPCAHCHGTGVEPAPSVQADREVGEECDECGTPITPASQRCHDPLHLQERLRQVEQERAQALSERDAERALRYVYERQITRYREVLEELATALRTSRVGWLTAAPTTPELQRRLVALGDVARAALSAGQSDA